MFVLQRETIAVVENWCVICRERREFDLNLRKERTWGMFFGPLLAKRSYGSEIRCRECGAYVFSDDESIFEFYGADFDRLNQRVELRSRNSDVEEVILERTAEERRLRSRECRDSEIDEAALEVFGVASFRLIDASRTRERSKLNRYLSLVPFVCAPIAFIGIGLVIIELIRTNWQTSSPTLLGMIGTVAFGLGSSIFVMVAPIVCVIWIIQWRWARARLLKTVVLEWLSSGLAPLESTSEELISTYRKACEVNPMYRELSLTKLTNAVCCFSEC